MTEEGVTLVNRVEELPAVTESTEIHQTTEKVELTPAPQENPEEMPYIPDNEVKPEQEKKKKPEQLPMIPEMTITESFEHVKPEITTVHTVSEVSTEADEQNTIEDNSPEEVPIASPGMEQQVTESAIAEENVHSDTVPPEEGEDVATEAHHSPVEVTTEKQAVESNEIEPDSESEKKPDSETQHSEVTQANVSITTPIPLVPENVGEGETQHSEKIEPQIVPVTETYEPTSSPIEPVVTEGQVPEEKTTEYPEEEAQSLPEHTPSVAPEEVSHILTEVSTESAIVTEESATHSKEVTQSMHETSTESETGVPVSTEIDETTVSQQAEISTERGESEPENEIPTQEQHVISPEEMQHSTEPAITPAEEEKLGTSAIGEVESTTSSSKHEESTVLPEENEKEKPAVVSVEPVELSTEGSSISDGSLTEETPSKFEEGSAPTEAEQSTERIHSDVSVSDIQNTEVPVEENVTPEYIPSTGSIGNEISPETPELTTVEAEFGTKTTPSPVQDTSSEGSKYEESPIESEEGPHQETVAPEEQTEIPESITEVSLASSEPEKQQTNLPEVTSESSMVSQGSEVATEEQTETPELGVSIRPSEGPEKIPEVQTEISEQSTEYSVTSEESEKAPDSETSAPELGTEASIAVSEEPEKTTAPDQQTENEEISTELSTSVNVGTEEVPEHHTETVVLSTESSSEGSEEPENVPVAQTEVSEPVTIAVTEESEKTPEEGTVAVELTEATPEVSEGDKNASEVQSELPSAVTEISGVPEQPELSTEMSTETSEVTEGSQKVPEMIPGGHAFPTEESQTEATSSEKMPEVETELPESPTDSDAVNEEIIPEQTEVPPVGSEETEKTPEQMTETPETLTEGSEGFSVPSEGGETVLKVTTEEPSEVVPSTERLGGETEEQKPETPEIGSFVTLPEPQATMKPEGITVEPTPEASSSIPEEPELEENTVEPERVITPEPVRPTEEMQTTKTEFVTPETPSDYVVTQKPEEVKVTESVPVTTPEAVQEMSSPEPEIAHEVSSTESEKTDDVTEAAKPIEVVTEAAKPIELVTEAEKPTEEPVRIPSVVTEITTTEGQKLSVATQAPVTKEPSAGYDYQKPINPLQEKPVKPVKPEDYDNVAEEKPVGQEYLPPDEDYEEEEEQPYGPGTCRYAGKVYVSAQQIPRDDPCDFCFCFRSDIICLQQSCPPPIPGCHEEPISGFCCPRYECHVRMATMVNVTSTTTTTTTTVPPHFFPHAYKGTASRMGCLVQGRAYNVGQSIPSASGPCMDCM